MSYFDLENNYQSIFGYFLNPLLFFNRDQNGLIDDNINNNMMSLNDNFNFHQNPKVNFPTITYYDNLSLDEQDTKWKTLKENNILPPPNQLKLDIDTKNESNKNCFSLEEIKDILKNKQISEKLKKNKYISNVEYKLFNKKRRRENDNEEENEDENKEEDVKKSKRGRKIKDKDNTNLNKIEHNKYSEDNIIKKIKTKILWYPLLFLNNILRK